MIDLRGNFERVRDAVEDACAKSSAGRNVVIIAVTKTLPLETVSEFLSLGLCADLGESRAQELRDKAGEFDKNVTWHFIGPIQTNKVKYIARDAAWVHSVDSRDIIDELEKRCAAQGRVMNTLVQVNISSEAQKGGVAPDAAEALIAYANEKPHLSVRGLMGIASYADESVVEREFAMLEDLRAKLQPRYPKLTELSMGMSGDHLLAIKHGSTMVRIGSGIFGERK